MAGDKLTDELYMQRCIDLARNGLRAVSPNPMVGCVIVCDDEIIGEGYHQKYGEAHAEVNAINQVKDLNLLSKATLYVSLEPCVHFGKTPPCADLILKHKIPKVVIGCLDPFAKVDGKGSAKLMELGVEVSVGVLEDECRKLNHRFFTFHEKKRPYIILKWAQTQDGFIDSLRETENKATKISSEESSVLVHKWRSEEDAILVGRKTVQQDDPELTVRKLEGINPARIILDSHLKTLHGDYKIFNDKALTLVLNLEQTRKNGNCELHKIETMELEKVLKKLHEQNFLSVIVEGGAEVLQSFIDKNLYDEARVIKSSKYLKKGVEAPKISKLPLSETKFFDDTIYLFK